MKLCTNGHPMGDTDKFCGICGANAQAIAPDFTPENQAAPAQPQVTPAQPQAAQPTYQAPVQPQPTPAQPQAAQPTYQQPAQPQAAQPTHQAPVQPQPTPAQPQTAQPTYQQPAQPQATQPTYQQPVQPQATQPTYQQPAQPQAAQPTYQQPVQPQATQPTYQTPVQPTYQNPGQPQATYQQPAAPAKKKGLPVGALIGIIVGGVVLVIAIVAVIIVLVSNKGGKFTVNDEDYQYNSEAEEGYAVCDTIFGDYLYTSFLYPSEDSLTYDSDGAAVVYLDSEEFIKVNGVEEDMKNLKKYFKNYVSELESEGYTVTDKGDIQTSSIGDKTVYRYACDVELNGSSLQANRYVEIYDGYYYEYTVVSSDGSEGTLKEIMQSLYPNSGAWIEYTEPEPVEPEDGADSTDGTDSDAGYTLYNFDDGSVLYYPSDIYNYAVNGGYDITLYFGNEDVIDVWCVEDTVAQDALADLISSTNEKYGEENMTYSDTQTLTSEDGSTWYYVTAYDSSNGYYLVLTAMDTVYGYTWKARCCCDDFNEDQANSVMTDILYYSTLY